MYNALYHFGSRWYSLHVALYAFDFHISCLPFLTGYSNSISFCVLLPFHVFAVNHFHVNLHFLLQTAFHCFYLGNSFHGATRGQWHETSGDHFTGPQGTDHPVLPGICISTESQPFCDHCSLHCRRTRRIHRGHRQSCLVLYIFVSPDIAVSHG